VDSGIEFQAGLSSPSSSSSSASEGVADPGGRSSWF
jgi:hypothetical protein